MSYRVGTQCVVSTHSRLKAAGSASAAVLSAPNSFNTQPPKGGWPHARLCAPRRESFNTQPPKGGWICVFSAFNRPDVSTHSRLKAAGSKSNPPQKPKGFNTQPPKGGWLAFLDIGGFSTGFNTQPPKGGWMLAAYFLFPLAGFNTQPPKGGWTRAKWVLENK